MKNENKLSSMINAATYSKWIWSLLIAMVLGVTVLGVTSCNKDALPVSGAHVQQYTCSMHPEVVKDAPGDCPKCGMKLVEKH
ncbi:MAG: heavy metal-binding domain-containing protein [Kiritimatiellae bacterium]|jgi:Cu(I)/Ag(I) efflux system membrane fusion protein|nr:heavy metal-binding domain-containing protein [Kiritimatiellia bacterium]